jgi:hypothetical protein
MTITRKNRFLSFIFVVLLVLLSAVLQPRAVNADADKELRIDAALSSGVRLLDIEGETYGLKAVPVLGVSVFPRMELKETLYLSLQVSLSYTFRSDYSGSYYYDSFGSLALLPQLGLILPGVGVNYALFIGGGLVHAFSDYDTGAHPAVTARIGFEWKKGLLSGIFLSYTHGFREGYQYHETLMVYGSTLLFRSSHWGRR